MGFVANGRSSRRLAPLHHVELERWIDWEQVYGPAEDEEGLEELENGDLPGNSGDAQQGGTPGAAMLAGGVIASDAVRHPFAPLPGPAREGLLELARALDPVALRWGH